MRNVGTIRIDIPECAVCGHSTHHSPTYGCGECREGPGAKEPHQFVPVEIDSTNPAWEALLAEAERMGLPKFYTSDLFRDWQAINREGADKPFLWVLRESGTDMIWLRMEVRNGPYTQDKALLYLRAHQKTWPDSHWYEWSGWDLSPLTKWQAEEKLIELDHAAINAAKQKIARW